MSLFRRIKSVSSFKLDLCANFLGAGWSALVQLACIPFYIKFIGVEGYGLMGFYLMSLGVVQILDFGITPTVNREMARYSVQPEMAGEARDLVRTLEIGYWAVGGLIGLGTFAAAPFIAGHWIRTITIGTAGVQRAVMLMGVLAFFQWPVSFYQAALIGLHRQVLANVLKIANATLSSGGALLVLWLVSPTVNAFFLWQVVVGAVQVSVLPVCLWRSLPHVDHRTRFNSRVLHNISRFAAGMSGITVSAMILTQLDKLIISKLFSLEVFGYYTLAGVFGRALVMLISPVFNTIFPRFSALVAMRDEAKLTDFYHRCSQLMTVILLPVTAVLALYSYEILLVWTRNSVVARNTAAIATILSIGTAINGLMNLPYVLQLSHGWTSIGLQLNIFFVVTLVPAIWVLATHYGAIGGASSYLIFMCAYMALGVPLTHRRLLQGEMRHWFVQDVGMPTIAALLVVGVARVLPLPLGSFKMAVASLSVVLIAAFLAAVLAAPLVRARVIAQLAMRRPGNDGGYHTTVMSPIGPASDSMASDLSPKRSK